jgi:hypothetical protein
VLRDDISNLQPLLFSLVAGNRQYIVQQGSCPGCWVARPDI